jgi:hypothetical protein
MNHIFSKIFFRRNLAISAQDGLVHTTIHRDDCEENKLNALIVHMRELIKWRVVRGIMKKNHVYHDDEDKLGVISILVSILSPEVHYMAHM